MSDNVADNNDSSFLKPSFMDLFAVHLAARLLGREHVLKYFNTDPPEDPSSFLETFQVYWRTPLLTDTCSISAPVSLSAAGTADEWILVFLDVTIEFDRTKREMTTKIGMMLQHGSEHAYVKAVPMSFSLLAAHCEGIGIDIECTAADAIGHTMGNALMGLAKRTTIKLQRPDGTNIATAQDLCHVDSVAIPVFLYYEDLQETGSLVIKSGTICLLNSDVSLAWRSSLVREEVFSKKAVEKETAAETTNLKVHDTQAATELTKSFESWLNSPRRVISVEAVVESKMPDEADGSGCSKLAAVEQGGIETVWNAIESSEGVGEAEPATALSSTLSAVTAAQDDNETEEKEEPKKPVTQVKRLPAGYVRVSNPKRRRRGKLAFAKPGE